MRNFALQEGAEVPLPAHHLNVGWLPAEANRMMEWTVSCVYNSCSFIEGSANHSEDSHVSTKSESTSCLQC